MRWLHAERLLATVLGVCELLGGPGEQFRQMLVGTGQKCAKDPVTSAAGQTVTAGSWEHSEALLALLGWL